MLTLQERSSARVVEVWANLGRVLLGIWCIAATEHGWCGRSRILKASHHNPFLLAPALPTAHNTIYRRDETNKGQWTCICANHVDSSPSPILPCPSYWSNVSRTWVGTADPFWPNRKCLSKNSKNDEVHLFKKTLCIIILYLGTKPERTIESRCCWRSQPSYIYISRWQTFPAAANVSVASAPSFERDESRHVPKKRRGLITGNTEEQREKQDILWYFGRYRLEPKNANRVREHSAAEFASILFLDPIQVLQ